MPDPTKHRSSWSHSSFQMLERIVFFFNIKTSYRYFIGLLIRSSYELIHPFTHSVYHCEDRVGWGRGGGVCALKMLLTYWIAKWNLRCLFFKQGTKETKLDTDSWC